MGSSQPGGVNTPPETLSRRQRENLRHRREILDAALNLFSEKGYHNVSMHEIAGKAEFGIGTLYKLFNNKEDLYKAIIMEGAEKWHRAMLQALEQGRNPLRTIKKLIALNRELFFENLSLVRLYFAETRGARFNVKVGFDQDLLRLHSEFTEKLASVFERGIKEKVFRALDPYHMAIAFGGIINAFLFGMMEDPARFGKEDNLSTATDIFLKGVLSK